MTNCQRPEYPRPDFSREQWINLNGTWEFEFDPGCSGKERNLFEAGKFNKEIIVPFCMESSLSGINYKDFMPAIWYRRTFTLPEDWKNKNVILNIGACDFFTRIYVNGKEAFTHKGGYTPIRCNITKLLVSGKNIITIEVQDDIRTGLQPAGKQSDKFYSYGCSYTRTTGIWQTVWLEAVPSTYIENFKLESDIDNARLIISVKTAGDNRPATISADISAHGKSIATASAKIANNIAIFTLDLPEQILWSPKNPFLYDIKLKLESASGIDIVNSYFGMRKIHIENRKLYLNNEEFYMRLVLDQGFYPDGIYTARSDDDLRKDIELSLAAGFNGARLHQKVFEPRFLYWADKLGYIVWEEAGSWKCHFDNPLGVANFIDEWLEVLQRDYNHPSIIGWCPLNETSRPHQTGSLPKWLHYHLYQINKTINPNRLAIDTSGYIHYQNVPSDLYDVHNYHTPETLEADLSPLKTGNWQQAFKNCPQDVPYDGTNPYFVSEFGGIWWNPKSTGNDWGYGDRPKSEQEFLDRYYKTFKVLFDNPGICGWCYTQLYDIEQEANGIYYYDRTVKFSADIQKQLTKITQGNIKTLTLTKK